MSTSDRREPIDLARDEIARRIEADFPGITVTHDIYGYLARWGHGERSRELHAQSEAAMRALLPYSGL